MSTAFGSQRMAWEITRPLDVGVNHARAEYVEQVVTAAGLSPVVQTEGSLISLSL
jgi:hypothetical protein